jgi:ech hydrogenase subunit F
MSLAKKIFSSTKEATRNLFRKPATIMFPAEHVAVPDGFRGPPILTPAACTLCLKCERICPTGAISIDKQDDTAEFTIDLGRCCYCQECENTCNFDAISLSDEWLTAEFTREGLKKEYPVEIQKKQKISVEA